MTEGINWCFVLIDDLYEKKKFFRDGKDLRGEK